MDALSDVLRAVRLTGAVFFDIRAADPWVAATPPGAAIVGAMFPGSEHLISYHVIIEGSCWAGRARRPAHAAAAPATSSSFRTAIRTCSPVPRACAPGRPVALPASRPTEQLPFTISMGESAGRVGALCLRLSRLRRASLQPAASALPRVIHVSDRGGALGSLRAVCAGGVEAAAHRRGERAQPPERADVRRRRTAVPGGPPGRPHRLARGPARPLRRPRADCPAPQSGARLGAAVPGAASQACRARLWRSASAVRRPTAHAIPHQLAHAAGHRQLLGGRESIAAIANRVGYDSEAAFSRTFKKVVGTSPSQWRRERERDLRQPTNAPEFVTGGRRSTWRTLATMETALTPLEFARRARRSIRTGRPLVDGACASPTRSSSRAAIAGRRHCRSSACGAATAS